jgi:signal transduction histidine kinase
MTNKQIPRWFIGAGVPLALGLAVLAIRLVWEQTLLSWQNGPQMVGFSLMHGGGGLLLVVLPIATLLWFPAALVLVARRRSAGGALGLATISVCAVSLVATLLPYSWWQFAFAAKLAHGPYAAEFLSRSAAHGHERLVTALLANGVAVNAPTKEGSTALHAAAISGETRMVQLLIARGADVNAVNRYGDSPLANAESSDQREVAELLRAQGAQLIRGTEEQRDRAAREIVREQSERLEGRR